MTAIYYIGGKENELGTPTSIENAHDRIFGMVLMNDWSGEYISYMYICLAWVVLWDCNIHLIFRIVCLISANVVVLGLWFYLSVLNLLRSWMVSCIMILFSTEQPKVVYTEISSCCFYSWLKFSLIKSQLCYAVYFVDHSHWLSHVCY